MKQTLKERAQFHLKHEIDNNYLFLTQNGSGSEVAKIVLQLTILHPKTVYSGSIDDTNVKLILIYDSASKKMAKKINISDFYLSTFKQLYISSSLQNLNFLPKNTNIQEHINSSSLHITDLERNNWNNKVSLTESKSLSTNDFTNLYKLKLENLFNYTHSVNHPASMITQNSGSRFVTDIQIGNWDNKSNLLLGTSSNSAFRGDYGSIAYNHATSSHAPSNATANQTDMYLLSRSNHTGTQSADTIVDGITNKVFTATLLTKLNNLQNYTHSADHPASMIVQNSSSRFVTDTQINTWNNKSDLSLGTSSTTAFRGDYGQLGYTHSLQSHAPSNATVNDTDANLKNRVNHTGTQSADTIVDGTNNKVFTATLLTKLNGISDNANNYSHPANHPASIITQDSSSRFVTDTQINTWNGKSNLVLGITDTTAFRGDYGQLGYTHSLQSHAPSNATVNQTDAFLLNRSNHTGTQSATTITTDANNRFITDVLLTKLNNLQNYTHSATHPASMILQDSSSRFVTDLQINTWDNRSTLTLGSTSTTAFRGDYGTNAYNHSQTTHAPSNAQKNSDITKALILAKLTGSITSHTHAGGGSVTKLDILLLLTGSISSHTHDYISTSHQANNISSETFTNITTAYNHATSSHAPSDAQKNSNILKSLIEAVLTGSIDSHTHTSSNPIMYGTSNPPTGSYSTGTIYFKI